MVKQKNWPRRGFVPAYVAPGSALSAGIGFSAGTWADLAYNLPKPVTALTEQVFDLHMLTARIGLYIMIVVTAIVVYALFKFRKSKGYQADQNFHSSWFGNWSWVMVPIIVLGIDLSIAGPGSVALDKVEEHIPPDMTLKVVGSQWKWTYEYMDDDIRVVSNLLPQEQAQERYLRDVDEPLVIPVDTQIRLLHTATDVLHAWWVPALAVKKDSIPGYINETYTNAKEVGTYYGQCAENCGAGHAYMPIKVQVVSKQEFAQWKSDKKAAALAAAEEAASNKTWSRDELMTKGEQVYLKNCAACHQANGQGLPPAFPALKGSPLMTGAIAEHIGVVVSGRVGTAMAAWGGQLNDLDMAAVVTYERNAWGNDSGDLVQPADVKAAR